MNLENDRTYNLILTYNRFFSNQCDLALSYNFPDDDKNIKNLLTKMEHLLTYCIDEVNNLIKNIKNN